MRLTLLVLYLLGALLLSTRGAHAEPPPATGNVPRIEVAFALDATGSMSPYIEQARARIQQVASDLATGEPKPAIRFGLVLFRDRGDRFVTRVHPFTEALATMQRYLDGAEADGGGDSPEAVLEGLLAAIEELGWSPSDPATPVVRLLYLIGDAPAQHYPSGPSEAQIEALARSKGIVLHTIVCGVERLDDGAGGADPLGLERLSRHTEGRSFALSQRAADMTRRPGARVRASLGATVASATRAYSASAGVRFDEAPFRPAPSEPLTAASLSRSGLLGGELRWVRDAATFADLWRVHTSLLPRDARPPLPSVDFASHEVLVLGGQDAGLTLVSLSERGAERKAEVETAEEGARFVVLPRAEVTP